MLGSSDHCSGFGTDTHLCQFNVDPGTGRAMFAASWLVGDLDVSILSPGPNGVEISENNFAGFDVSYSDVSTGTVKQKVYAIEPVVEGSSLPAGLWTIRLNGISLDPQALNNYQLAFAADPPAPQIEWQSVLQPETTPVGKIVTLSWQVTRAGVPINQSSDPNVTMDLVYAPVYQPPSWQARSIAFPGSFVTAAGLGGNWDPSNGNVSASDSNQDNVWTLTTDSLPAGDFAFKVAINNSWDENYGLDGVSAGENINFTVETDNQPITFYYDPRDNYVTNSAREEIIVIAGDMMSEIGGADWAPDNLVGWMKPRTQDDLHELILHVPQGEWAYKVAINESWAENYGADGVPGGANIQLSLTGGDAFVRFLYDGATHVVSHEVLAGTPGTMIVGQLRAGTITHDWKIDSLAAGEYKVGLRVDDHFQGNGQTVRWAPGTVVVVDNEPPPIPTVLEPTQIPDGLYVNWERDDLTPDLAGFLVEYEIPGYRATDPYIPVTRRVVQPPKLEAQPYNQIRLGGLMMSVTTLPDLIRPTLCVRAYDASGNVSGCTPFEVVMEEEADSPYLGPPQYLGVSNDNGALSVSWEPPLIGSPFGYLLHYAPIGCGDGETHTIAFEGESPIDVENTITYLLNGLAFNQTYLIEVQGYLENGILGEKAYATGLNLNLVDSDNNGLPDEWSEVYGIENPNSDLDKDGLPASVEAILGSSPFKADSDGDGYYDGEEAAWQTAVCGSETPPEQIQPKLAISGVEGILFDNIPHQARSAAQTVDIFNLGAGTLAWSAESSDSWIKLEQASGTGLAELGVSVDMNGMNSGSYQGSVTIRASHASVTLPSGRIVPAIEEAFTIQVYVNHLPELGPPTGPFYFIYLPQVVR